MKRRSDSSLAKLNEDQLSDLYDWIDENGYTKAQHKAAEPAPEGFGLKLHKNSLFRFFQQEQRRRHAERLAELAIKADDNAMPPEVAQVWKATRVEFAHATFELASTNCAPGGAGGVNYDRVDRALHRFEIADLGRNRHQLARECAVEARRQWQFDAARKALDHAAALQKIAADPVLDNQDKIWAAHDICFGPDSDFSSEPSLPSFPSVKNPDPENLSKSPSPSVNIPTSAIANPQSTDTQVHAVPHCTTPASPSEPEALRNSAASAVSTSSQISPSEKSAPSAVKESESPSPSPSPQLGTPDSGLSTAACGDTQSHAVPHCTAPDPSSPPHNPCPASAVMCQSPSRHGGDAPSVVVTPSHSFIPPHDLTSEQSELSAVKPFEPSAPSLSSVENSAPENLCKSVPSVVNTSASTPCLSDSVVNPNLPSEIAHPQSNCAAAEDPLPSWLLSMAPFESPESDESEAFESRVHPDAIGTVEPSEPSLSPLAPDENPAPTSASQNPCPASANSPVNTSSPAFLSDPRFATYESWLAAFGDPDSASPQSSSLASVKPPPPLFEYSNSSAVAPSDAPNPHSAIPHPQSAPVPEFKPILQWLREAKQPGPLKQYFLAQPCVGSVHRLGELIRAGCIVTIKDPDILRDLA